MIGKRIPQLPNAPTVGADDLLVIEQDGRTKRTTAGNMVGGVVIPIITEFVENIVEEQAQDANYLLGVAGSVVRPIKERLGDIVSVKDFGAVGDGITDDLATLQAAIDSGASRLLWPSGHYAISGTLKPASNQEWIGAIGEVLIKQLPATPTNKNVIGHNWDDVDGSLDNFSMTGFVIDGSDKEGGFVLQGCNGLRVTDCTFQNCGTYGMGLQARPGHTVELAQDDIILTRCHFNNNGPTSVWDGLDIKYCTNTKLYGCTAHNNTDAGLNLRGSNVDLIGCSATDNGTAGILLQTNYTAGFDSYMRVSGGQASGTTGGTGLELQGDTGNTLYVEVSGFQAITNTGVGVRVSGSGKVTGSITGTQAKNNTSHGFHITGDYVGSLSFNGCLSTGNAGDGFRTAGTGSVLNGMILLSNTGAGYREDVGANNNYVLPSCVISGNGTDIPARVGVETNAGFLAVRNSKSIRAFPGNTSGLELQTDSAGLYSNLAAVGDATSIDLRVTSKGNGDVDIFNSAGARQLGKFREAGTAIVNYPDFIASLTGTPVQLKASGSDTNIDIQLTPQGTGTARFGTHTANADAPVTGYITIKDAAGNVRKLAVIT